MRVVVAIVQIQAGAQLMKRDAQIQIPVLRPGDGDPWRDEQVPAAITIRKVLDAPSNTSRYRKPGVQSTCALSPTRVRPRPAIRGEITARPELRSTDAIKESEGANLTEVA